MRTLTRGATSTFVLLVIAISISGSRMPIGASQTFLESSLQQKTTERQTQAEMEAIEEAPVALEPEARAAREAKNRRYDTGGQDLTLVEADSKFVETYCGCSLPLFPISKSAVVVIGTLIIAQPYLSNDRSRIYTELTVRVDEVLKSGTRMAPGTNDTIIVDRPGGTLRVKSGRIVRDDVIIGCLGEKPRVGGRYVLFANRIHDQRDVSMLTGYELRAGKVFTLDQGGTRPVSSLRGVLAAFEEEQKFLQALRQAVSRSKR